MKSIFGYAVIIPAYVAFFALLACVLPVVVVMVFLIWLTEAIGEEAAA